MFCKERMENKSAIEVWMEYKLQEEKKTTAYNANMESIQGAVPSATELSSLNANKNNFRDGTFCPSL